MSIDQLCFTRCSSDKGRERIDGFQIKACSEGITGEMEKKVRFFSQEYHWPTSLDALVRPGSMAAEDFAKFPVSLHYYRVADGRFGLTRICIAPVQPGRAGNFFAHTLVFPPEALQPVSYNPFALARSDIFQQQDESSRTELPVLNDFSKLRVREDKKCWDIATVSPYAEHLAPLVDVLSTSQSERPVIILPSSLQDAWGLVEAVLLLLPSKFRIGIEFSIYEPDPYRVRNMGQNDKFNGQKLITTAPREEGGKFQFRSDEYAGQYYVFNFTESQFSNFPTPSAYAQRVVADCQSSRLQEVFRLQSWLDRLNVDIDAHKWSSSLVAIDYFDPSEHRSKTEMQVAIDSLVSTCCSPVQAKAAAAAIVDLLVIEAGVCPESGLRAAISSLGTLIDRTDEMEKVKQGTAKKLSETMTSMLSAGRAIVVQSASEMLGTAGRNMLGPAVEHLLASKSVAFNISASQQAASPADTEALPEIMNQGLCALFEEPGRLRLRVLLPEAMLFAHKAGCLPALWSRLKPWLMSEFLDTLPGTEAAELSRRIAAEVSGERCHQAWLDLIRWQLCSTSVPKDIKVSSVSNLAAVCRKSSNPSETVPQVLVEAAAHLDELSYLALLESFVSDIYDEVSVIAEKAYDKHLASIPEQERWKLRRKKLVSRRMFSLVSREFVRSVWPWSEERGPNELDKWMDQILEPFPETNDVVAKHMADLAVGGQDRIAIMSLLSAYLSRATLKDIDRHGKGARSIVARSLIAQIPLGSMQPTLVRDFNNIQTENWPLHDVVRFDLMREMAHIGKMYDDGQERSFDDLLNQRPRLSELLKSKDLDNTERQQALEWAIEISMAGAGIDDVKSAKSLLDVMIESGSQIQTFSELLIKGLSRTHLIKQILTVSQFVLLAGTKVKDLTDIPPYIDTRPSEDFPKLVKNIADLTIWLAITLARQMSNENRKLLWGYLAERRRNARWQVLFRELQAATDGKKRPPVEQIAKGDQSMSSREIPKDRDTGHKEPAEKATSEEGWLNRIVRSKLPWGGSKKLDAKQESVIKSKIGKKNGKG